MFNVMSKKLILSVTLGTLLPTLTLAATPTAYLEQSKVIATGRQIRAYRVPTKDINGQIKYYDVTVTLPVLADGKFDATASVITILSPSVLSNQFVAGTYTDNQGTTCTVHTAILNGGRVEVAVTCINSGDVLSATWATGLITGHPFELDLRAASIDKIPGYANYSWGKVGNADYAWWSCFIDNDVISARQVGSTLSLSRYGTNNTVDCGTNLMKK